jgi:restriction endonuclease Mrr
VTCGRFSEDALQRAKEAEDLGKRIRLIEGDELAKMIVEYGTADLQDMLSSL